MAWNGEAGKPETTFQYYGLKLHPSRVFRVLGKQAPTLARMRLQAWGMSIIESIIRESNASLKHENVVFELLDEAKVDIWNIEGFNSQHLNKAAAGQLTSRMRLAAQLKNFLNAIILDSKDKYEQKQMSFSGFPRQGPGCKSCSFNSHSALGCSSKACKALNAPAPPRTASSSVTGIPA